MYGDQTWTLRSSALHSRRLAELFAQVGVTQGDRVLFVAHNSPYHLLAYIACARLGAVFVPVSHRMSRTELAAVVDFTSPRVIIADTEVAAAGPIVSTGTVTNFVIDDDPAAGPLGPALENGFFALGAACEGFDAALVADAPYGLEELNRHAYPSGVAALLFTGASVVSKPCAVELTHENLWWSGRNLQEAISYSHDDKTLACVPMSHAGGFNGALIDLFTSGGCVVVMRSFDATEALRILTEEEITVFFAVPTMYSALVSALEESPRDMSHLNKAMIGGARVTSELYARLEAVGLYPANVWGITEAAGAGTFLPWGRGKEGAIGRPLNHVEVRVVDPVTLEDAPEGELIVRGPSVSAGYWHNEESNRSSYTGGWLRTGDHVRVDEGLRLLGRFVPRISTGAQVVDPEEVERVLREFPGIGDAAVVGLPDPYWGEVVAAVIVPTDDAEAPNPSDIQAFVGQVLAHYKIPRTVMVASSLERDEHGIRRELVREKLIAAQK